MSSPSTDPPELTQNAVATTNLVAESTQSTNEEAEESKFAPGPIYCLNGAYGDLARDTSINFFRAKAVAPKYRSIATIDHLLSINRTSAICGFGSAHAKRLLQRYDELEKDLDLKDGVIIDERKKIDAMRIESVLAAQQGCLLVRRPEFGGMFPVLVAIQLIRRKVLAEHRYAKPSLIVCGTLTFTQLVKYGIAKYFDDTNLMICTYNAHKIMQDNPMMTNQNQSSIAKLQRFDIILTTHNTLGEEFERSRDYEAAFHQQYARKHAADHEYLSGYEQQALSKVLHDSGTKLLHIDYLMAVMDESSPNAIQYSRNLEAACHLKSDYRLLSTHRSMISDCKGLAPHLRFLRVAPFDVKNTFETVLGISIDAGEDSQSAMQELNDLDLDVLKFLVNGVMVKPTENTQQTASQVERVLDEEHFINFSLGDVTASSSNHFSNGPTFEETFKTKMTEWLRVRNQLIERELSAVTDGMDIDEN